MFQAFSTLLFGKDSLTEPRYDLLPGVLSMSSAAFLILSNSMLCVVAIYAALYWSSDALGVCLLVQSIGMFFVALCFIL